MNDPSRMSTKVGTMHSFRCARCGEIAATIEKLGSGPVAAGAGPLGDEILLDLDWRGMLVRQDWFGTSMKVVKPETVELIAADTVDPLELNRVDRAFGLFCCWACKLNYCEDCWTHWRERDNARGRCPEGHEQWIMYN